MIIWNRCKHVAFTQGATVRSEAEAPLFIVLNMIFRKKSNLVYKICERHSSLCAKTNFCHWRSQVLSCFVTMLGSVFTPSISPPLPPGSKPQGQQPSDPLLPSPSPKSPVFRTGSEPALSPSVPRRSAELLAGQSDRKTPTELKSTFLMTFNKEVFCLYASRTGNSGLGQPAVSQTTSQTQQGATAPLAWPAAAGRPQQLHQTAPGQLPPGRHQWGASCVEERR